MPSNLENSCLITIAARFWALHKFENFYEIFRDSGFKSATRKFCDQVDLLKLPETHKAELKLIIIDFGWKKRFAMQFLIGKGISLPYANTIRWNGNGMVDLDESKKEWTIMQQSPSAPPLHSAVSKRILEKLPKDPRPIYFLLHRDRETFLEFQEQTPTVGRFAHVRYDEIPLPFQPAGFQISLLGVDRLNYKYVLSLSRHMEHTGPETTTTTTDIFRFDYPDRNSDVAEFVFEVLNAEQRQQILKLGQSQLITESDEFSSFFANLFCHWPWQDEAFDSCFATRNEISEAECLVLKKIIDFKKGQEMDILPPDRSFYKKVERFHDSVCHSCKIPPCVIL